MHRICALIRCASLALHSTLAALLSTILNFSCLLEKGIIFYLIDFNGYFIILVSAISAWSRLVLCAFTGFVWLEYVLLSMT
jgi:hypothetical protein